MSGSTLSPDRTSLTPNPLAYTVFPPCTTATAIPGMPDFFINSSAMSSSLETALSTALAGRSIAGTSGGGTSDRDDWAAGGACLRRSGVTTPHHRRQHGQHNRHRTELLGASAHQSQYSNRSQPPPRWNERAVAGSTHCRQYERNCIGHAFRHGRMRNLDER